MFRQLIYCTVPITIFASTTFGQKTLVKQRKASIIYCDSSTLNNYKAELANYYYTHKWDSAFIRKFFAIIHKFNGKPLDTTIITTGKLDENGNHCKIRTRVYYYDSAVFVESRLTMNHKLLWKYSFKDPFHPVSSNAGNVELPELFDWQTRDTWVDFTSGIYDGPPEFIDYKSSRLFPDDSGLIIDYGISDLKKKGFNLLRKQYISYLNNFKGDLFTYGDNISRECAHIWYSPANCFILFYAP